MATTYDKASLVMIPSGYKDTKLYSVKPTDGDGDFTFSRGSNLAATRVNASGLIEKGRENVLLQSNSFDTTWGGANFSLTSGQSDSDGGANAWLYNATGGSTRLGQGLSINGVLTMSIKFKYVNTQYAWLKIQDNATPRQAWFDIQNGNTAASTGAISSKITDIGGGWYLCEVAANSAATSYIQFGISTADGSQSSVSGNQAFIYQSQIEQGLVATDYIETTTTSVQAGILEDMPRLDYSGGASCPSLLLEPQRTNLFTQSEFVGWTIDNSTADYNNATSPEGVQNAILLTANGGSQDHTAYVETSSLSPATYTYSVFVKKGTQRYVHLTLNERYVDSNWITATFDLDTLTKADHSSGTGYVDGTSDITNYGNDWYRLEMTGALVNTTTYLAFVGWANGLGAPNTSRGRYNVTTSNTFYAYGAQLEAGSYPTSYIPTYGSAVTKSKDSCLKTGISDLIGQTEGTLFMELDDVNFSPTGGAQLCSLDDGTNQKRIEIYTDTLNRIGVYVQDTTAQVNQTTSVVASGRVKIALSYALNNYALYINGTLAHSDTSASVPATSAFRAFGRYDGLANGSQEMKQALLFKTRLTNAELATLTTL